MAVHHTLKKKARSFVSFFLLNLFGMLSSVVPPLATRIAERMFLTPVRSRRPNREQRWADTAQRTSISSEFGPLACWTWGEGPQTVVLVHGWAGRGLQLGAFVEPLVTRGFRVVTYDAPGHGESPGRISVLPYFSRALSTVVREVGSVQAVIAHSLGATAAILSLERKELDIDQFIAIAPPSRLDSVGDRFAEMTGFSTSVVGNMQKRICRRFGFDWEAMEPLRLAPRMTVPLLVMHDHRDREIPWQESSALANAWPDATAEFTDGLGHRRVLRDPDIVNSIAAFVARNRSSRRLSQSDRKQFRPEEITVFPSTRTEQPRENVRRTT